METLLTKTFALGIIEFGMLIILVSLLLIIIGLGSRKKLLIQKLDKIQKHLDQVQEEIKFLNTGYGAIDKNLSTSKDDLNSLNETIRSIQKDIGQKNDENFSEQNINKAIDLAKLGLSANEIREKTGLSEEQIETILKFHTPKSQ
ncbi:MAG: hypothetical protein P8L82_02760 [Paracoccaceae bacterium]|nr:hypothetical protein [Paracoccaceae bacterium]